MSNKVRALLGSPIRQEPEVLKAFLDSLCSLEKENVLLDFFFIDDNDISSSRDLLASFPEITEGKVIIEQRNKDDIYIRGEDTHYWKENLVWKVAEYKNRIIDYCKQEDYDYLFFVDSDIVLHPKTLIHLIGTSKDIISEIFWTKWHKNSIELPQVWLYDHYSLVPKKRLENIDQAESDKRYNNFIEQLRQPGVYEVGGLGACTLINRQAINAGVNFNEIYNISFWGEDRHFCIRAAAIGLKLYVDTTYPAYHIYRQEDLGGVEFFKNKCKSSSFQYTDILKERAFNFAKEFLEAFYSCDYNTNKSFLEVKFLNADYTNRYNSKKMRDLHYIATNRTICSAIVKEITANSFTESDKKISLQCKCLINAQINQEFMQKNFICNLVLDRQQNDYWLISEIKVFSEDRKLLFGFTLSELIEGKERLFKTESNKVTLSMLVRNESKKFIREMLSHASKYIDNAVILDDASDDDTVEICKEMLKDIPLTIVSNKEHGFNNEIALRKQLWQMTIDSNPDWILCLDADEIFEDKIIDIIKGLIDQPNIDHYSFRLYDMWDNNHYRDDGYWQSHNYYRIFLLRYQPNYNYLWNEIPLHCGRLPQNLYDLNGCICYVKLKHFGWSTEELRKEKYSRYLGLDPEGKYGNVKQYESILDQNPKLVKWE
jgi:hypothetical protein